MCVPEYSLEASITPHHVSPAINTGFTGDNPPILFVVPTSSRVVLMSRRTAASLIPAAPSKPRDYPSSQGRWHHPLITPSLLNQINIGFTSYLIHFGNKMKPGYLISAQIECFRIEQATTRMLHGNQAEQSNFSLFDIHFAAILCLILHGRTRAVGYTRKLSTLASQYHFIITIAIRT